MSGHLVAAAYRAAGFSLVPVRPGRKSPPLLDWTEFESRHPSYEEIKEWWALWPEANIAIVTGTISNLSVIDVDEASGGVKSLQQKGYTFPETRVHKTPAGYHLLYEHNAALHTGAGFLKGVDCRSDGGYIIAPPSRSEKGHYRVFKDRPIIPLFDAPDFLKATRRTTSEPGKPSDPSWVVDAMRGVPLNLRNETATRLVGYYHRKGLPGPVIATVMESFARSCSPPMDQRELQITIASVLRYPGGGKEWAGWQT